MIPIDQENLFYTRLCDLDHEYMRVCRYDYAHRNEKQHADEVELSRDTTLAWNDELTRLPIYLGYNFNGTKVQNGSGIETVYDDTSLIIPLITLYSLNLLRLNLVGLEHALALIQDTKLQSFVVQSPVVSIPQIKPVGTMCEIWKTRSIDSDQYLHNEKYQQLVITCLDSRNMQLRKIMACIVYYTFSVAIEIARVPLRHTKAPDIQDILDFFQYPQVDELRAINTLCTPVKMYAGEYPVHPLYKEFCDECCLNSLNPHLRTLLHNVLNFEQVWYDNARIYPHFLHIYDGCKRLINVLRSHLSVDDRVNRYADHLDLVLGTHLSTNINCAAQDFINLIYKPYDPSKE